MCGKLLQGEEPDETNALVMIPRAPIKIPVDAEGGAVPLPLLEDVEETDGSSGLALDMSSALPPKKNTKRAQVKNRDWRSSIQAYNEL